MINSEEVVFCSGESLVVPGVVTRDVYASTTVLADQTSTMFKLWISTLVLFFMMCYAVCCVSLFIIGPAIAGLVGQEVNQAAAAGAQAAANTPNVVDA